jgi:hypothetical protein
VFPLSIEFSNIEIPIEYETEIDGYHIVRVTRDENNSTVLDAGVYGGQLDYEIATFFPEDGRKITSPKIHLRQQFLNADYVKVEYLYDDLDTIFRASTNPDAT